MPKLINQGKDYNFSTYATIGRSSKCTVPIDDIKLSRVHCEIIRYGGNFLLIDLHSQNGTQLNKQPVTEAILHHGDTITLGRAELIFESIEPDRAGDQVAADEILPPLKPIAVKKIGAKDLQNID